ncbi:hypothetical protein PISMIDRAFT_672105 [Pisolithus microcarpus 441]|uniref:Uncharacterized protein n=1 Tax=Pisolithus microcarpus 441 TaxID=765257 RepID=A0A0D0ABM6_9AGAM|nr:hypothetical protein PISMIDRAFT_672105 [Pisolithus microcarpus 441]
MSRTVEAAQVCRLPRLTKQTRYYTHNVTAGFHPQPKACVGPDSPVSDSSHSCISILPMSCILHAGCT